MKLIYKNKKALFDYEILDNFTAGIVLTGSEVKAVRGAQINLKGAYVSVKCMEVYLKNANISRYKYDSNEKYDPFRERKLLLKKGEIERMIKATNTQGVTIIPISVVLDGRNIKIEIATARGKKKHDKRHAIKDRDVKRRLQRIIAR